MVEQGNAHLKRVSHTCAIDFRKDIAGEVSLEIGVLDLCQRILAVAPRRVCSQHFASIIALQLTCEALAEQPSAKLVTAKRDGREVRLHRVAGKLLEGRLRSKWTGSPVELGINSAK